MEAHTPAEPRSALIIRPVRPADFPAWSVLWAGYNAFYGRSGPTALAPAIIETTWSRFFNDHEPVHALVAERDGELLGLAHFLFHRNTILIEPICYMQDLFTLDTARGQGVGRRLIEGVYASAAQAGATRVYWHTRETNSTARALYDQVAEFPGSVVYVKHL
ncbi:GNAT family N-acetyltransferase [Duganella sp. LX20W]|uniref:GNAT family N-acetyltransferase n=1 Tax=Rugamonas brunnea TaxID=2758569 RepID=A0A7W2IB70_9BURK|nr:GNAT family N-acetyltransferase [Rugamonas brunnea]MBA5637034.1 GNAT family N-acetyltransferase [Rugamonas brunnea]